MWSSFRIEPTLFNTLGALTANNLAVQIKEDPNNPGDYIGFVKNASDVETNVFTISFSDTNLGQYTFTLSGSAGTMKMVWTKTRSFSMFLCLPLIVTVMTLCNVAT